MFIPQTKGALKKEIHRISDYTYKQIDEVYNQVVTKHSTRNKYYAIKAGVKRLQAMLISLNKKLGV